MPGQAKEGPFRSVGDSGSAGSTGSVSNLSGYDLAHALRAAEDNEQAFVRRLHRVHDPAGMHLLRELRERIAVLKLLLSQRAR